MVDTPSVYEWVNVKRFGLKRYINAIHLPFTPAEDMGGASPESEDSGEEVVLVGFRISSKCSLHRLRTGKKPELVRKVEW